MKPKIKSFKMVQVGVGAMGSIWLSLIKKRKDIKIVGLADIDPYVIRRLKDEFKSSNILISRDFKKIINNLKPDFVLDVTPPKVRSKNLLFYLKNNINVLCEKPLVNSTKKLDQIMLAKKNSKSKLMISQNYRWSKGSTYLKKIISGNKYGKVKKIRITYFSNYKVSGWRAKTKNVFILDMAIHHLDLVLYTTSNNFKHIWCNSNNTTTIKALLDNNINFEYTGTWNSKYNQTSRAGSWNITTDHATILWDGDYTFTIISNGINKKIRIKPETKDKLDISMDKYIGYINGGELNHISLEDNKSTLESVFACMKSTTSKKVILI